MKNVSKLVLVLLLSVYSTYAQESYIELILVEGQSVNDVKEVSESVNAYVYQSAIDLTGVEVSKKKQAFINLLLPSILIAKHKIAETRESVLIIVNSEFTPSIEEEAFLQKLKKTYKCKSNIELLSRLQTHPPLLLHKLH
mgnify:FL=1